MFRALFVSDLHLTPSDDVRVGSFTQFLHSLNANNLTHLFLVGDIFDLWIGNHDYFKSAFESVVSEIQRIRNSGIEVHYFEGNHDLYLREYWQDQLGVNVHPGPKVFDFGFCRVRVEHGDQTDPTDYGYRFLRWFLRTSAMVFLARHLPETAVLAIGQRASHSSRKYTSQIKAINENSAREKLHWHAQKVAEREAFDLLINGHVHVRDEYVFNSGGRAVRAINLGSWLSQPYWAYELTSDQSRFIELQSITGERGPDLFG